ncbi:MAG TPA: double zinc ribbon domain-containing protein, partial [Rhizomicrobium sp.]
MSKRLGQGEGRIHAANIQCIAENSVGRACAFRNSRRCFQHKETLARGPRGAYSAQCARFMIKNVGNAAQASQIRRCDPKLAGMTAIFDKLAPLSRRLGRAALDLLFPPLCMMCRKQVGEPGSLCSDCWQNVS